MSSLRSRFGLPAEQVGCSFSPGIVPPDRQTSMTRAVSSRDYDYDDAIRAVTPTVESMSVDTSRLAAPGPYTSRLAWITRGQPLVVPGAIVP